ncbi:HAD-IIIA family hydrolase [Rhizobiales bacterium TNE-4]|nr:HAD-IIIA family hydrolase [Rhizobiales bacterium TNE-4]MBV1827563.1 HAD-IIIA family hydrolase [Rhizobiales bacterium TNE-4]
MRQAVILAGGKGTRLSRVLGGVPKPLADVEGETLLGHQLRLLEKNDINNVVLLLGHGADQIQNWVKNFSSTLDINCVVEQEPRGTAGAVIDILGRLNDEFLVLYADTMVGIDLNRFWNWHHKDSTASASLFLHPNDHPADSDLVELDSEDKILNFFPYPHAEGRWFPNLVNAALYIIRRDSLLEWKDERVMLDFGKHIFPEMLNRGHILRGYNSPEYIKDAGTPERLNRVRKAFSSGLIDRSSLSSKQHAIFIDRDGTLNYPKGHIARAEQLDVYPGIGAAIRRLNDTEWRCVVVTNQPVIARGEATEKDLRTIHAKLDTIIAQDHAFIDRYYYCPHHTDSGFPGEVKSLKFRCGCRKPATGLLERAISDLNINPFDSWLIGDSTADLGAAFNAGISSILVETGEAGLDDRHPYCSRFSAANFPEAVEFILDVYPVLINKFRPVLDVVSAGQDWFIGGPVRSGKTSIAALFERELRKRSISVKIVNVDQWLLSKGINFQDLLNDFKSSEFLAFSALVSRRKSEGICLDLPKYSNKLGVFLKSGLPMQIQADDVVVWEGRSSLKLASLIGSGLTIHVDDDINLREKRFHRFYELCGFSSEKSLNLWRKCQYEDEVLLSRPELTKFSFKLAS